MVGVRGFGVGVFQEKVAPAPFPWEPGSVHAQTTGSDGSRALLRTQKYNRIKATIPPQQKARGSVSSLPFSQVLSRPWSFPL